MLDQLPTYSSDRNEQDGAVHTAIANMLDSDGLYGDGGEPAPPTTDEARRAAMRVREFCDNHVRPNSMFTGDVKADDALYQVALAQVETARHTIVLANKLEIDRSHQKQPTAEEVAELREKLAAAETLAAYLGERLQGSKKAATDAERAHIEKEGEHVEALARIERRCIEVAATLSGMAVAYAQKFAIDRYAEKRDSTSTEQERDAVLLEQAAALQAISWVPRGQQFVDQHWALALELLKAGPPLESYADSVTTDYVERLAKQRAVDVLQSAVGDARRSINKSVDARMFNAAQAEIDELLKEREVSFRALEYIPAPVQFVDQAQATNPQIIKHKI